jgi:nitrite reductase (NO-forming)
VVRALPVIEPTGARAPIRRGADRRVTFAGLATAAILLGLAGAAAVLRLGGGQATWLALHLALAGAATTAIASLMPFFTTALARVAPARPVARIVAILCVASGALAVAGGVAGGGRALAVVGGVAYLVGLVLTAANAFLPLRSTLGLGLRTVPLAYGAALGCVAAGAALATALLAGWQPVVAAWAVLKPAHAWLNVFGFLSVAIAATLVHLAPTVAGARIRRRRSASSALIGLVAGAPIVAIGFASGSDGLVRIGATLELFGAAALVAHGIGVQRDHGRWTGDAGWHRFTGLSLLAAPVWLVVSVMIATEPILLAGATPSAWSVGPVAAPLAVGWVAQVLIGSWSHLLPAIGPGDQAVHARQRRRLGTAAVPRWVMWNGGLALVVFGGAGGSDTAGAFGTVAVAGSLFVALGLLLASIVVDTRPGLTRRLSPERI